jgi:Ca2+-binding RTX toxin-like protein
MVTKYVNYAYEGDLLNLSDNFGLGNDTLYLSLPSPNLAPIRTYQGNDYVTVTNIASGGYGYKFYLGSGNDTLFGSNLSDRYYDEGGNDQISMGAGHDHVIAGPGDDIVNGGTGSDWIVFGEFMDAFGGSLPIAQGVTLNLANTGPQDLGIYGNDTFINFETVLGGAGDDTFLGTNGTNGLWGGGGADYLRGLGGDDFIYGGSGSDTLIGDAGADELDAGFAFGSPEPDGDADIIKYFRISDSAEDGGVDTIFNFEHFAGGGSDKIDLSYLDATFSLAGNQAFQFVGGAAFSSANGEVRLIEFGGDTLIWVDNDSDATAEMVIVVDGVTGLTADDFIL